MSSRSQSSAYKSGLTYRFTNVSRSKLRIILENIKSPGRLKSTLAKRNSTLTTDGLNYLEDSSPFDIHNAEVLKHQPLQNPSTQLRYLYLLPKTHNIDLHGQTVVRCELLSDVEEQTPRYIALSYTWGDPGIRRPILIGDRIFWATENLAIALEHLQEEKKTIAFWVDAVCIDQNNLNEKSVQVQRMGEIFASAALVIAWLGPAADESDLALQALQNYWENDSRLSEELRHTDDEMYTVLPLQSINALFNRSWFKRVWVGQEVALNEKVTFVCGQCDIDRDTLFLCYRKLILGSFWTGIRLSGIYARFEAQQALPLRDFLENAAAIRLSFSCDLESTDPKDFIYSCFGQISDAAKYGLRVDYTKTVEEVYTEFTEAVIQADMIDLVSSVWQASVDYKNLPSWVPDWSNTEACRVPPNCHRRVEEGNMEVCDVGRASKALKISARRIAQIRCVSHNLHPHQEGFGLDLSTPVSAVQKEEERVMLSLDIFRQYLDNKNRWSPEEAEKAVFNLSTSMSRATRLWHDRERARLEKLYESYRAFRGLKTPPGDVSDTEQWRRDASRVYLNVIRWSRIEDVFMASTDVIGISRNEVQPGDWVCELGCITGVRVLREVDGGFHRIVSVADIFPWEDVANSDAPVETITII